MIIAPMVMPRKVGAAPMRPSRLLLIPLLSALAAAQVLPLVWPSLSVAAEAQTQIKSKSADLARIKSKIDDVKQALAEDRSRRDTLQSAVEQAERKLRDGRAKLNAATRQLQAQDDRLAKAKAAHDAAQQQLRIEQAVLASQLRAAYILGSGNRLQLLLSAQDPGLVGRMLGYYSYLGRARADDIAKVDKQIEQVATLERQIADERDHLDALKQQRASAVHDLQHEKLARQQAVAGLKARISDRSAQLRQLRASEHQVEKLLDSLKTALSGEPYDLGNHTPFDKLKGRLPWPLRGPLLAHYGEEKSGGPLQWKGQWIAADEGTPVHASARGRVVYSGWISSYGLIVLLQHDGNYFTLYGHTATVDVKVGSTVNAGQVIAQAGETGGYDRSGVYFEVRHGSRALDPGKWLSR